MLKELLYVLGGAAFGAGATYATERILEERRFERPADFDIRKYIEKSNDIHLYNNNQLIQLAHNKDWVVLKGPQWFKVQTVAHNSDYSVKIILSEGLFEIAEGTTYQFELYEPVEIPPLNANLRDVLIS
jgi:hypothetical protein